MDEITQRRIIGAAALFLVAYLIASLLPDRESEPAELLVDTLSEPGLAPKVVVYDLNAPVREPVTPAVKEGDVEMPVPARPVAPVLSLESTESSSGASQGWYVQLGGYASASSAQAALLQASTSGYSGAVQMTLKDKKKLYRARIGPFASKAEAQQAQQAVAQLGFADARMIEIWKP